MIRSHVPVRVLRRLAPHALGGVASLLAVPGLAADQPAEAQGLEEVVVSAQFREERLQETPLAITAFTQESLEARSLTDVSQLDAMVPNAVISPLGAGYGSTIAAFIRGVGLGDNSLSFEPGVPIYVDDVYLGRPQGAILDLLDLERVEVLRGPQGALFGRNAVGGAVRMVSRKPQGDGRGTFEATTGSFHRMDFRGSFDASLIQDRLFMRIAASSKKRDGYFSILDYECVNGPGSLGAGGTTGIPAQGIRPIRLGSQTGPTDGRGCKVDELGNENVQSARVAFRLLAREGLEFNLIGDYTTQNQKGPADKYTFINGAFSTTAAWNANVGVPVFGVPYDSRFITNSNYTGYHVFGVEPLTGRNFPNINNLDHYGISGTAEWKITDRTNLKFITAYRDFDNEFGRDSDGSPLPVNPTYDLTKHDQFTAELQLTGNAWDRLDWAAGAFYYDGTDSNQGYVTLYPYLVQKVDHRDVQDSTNWALFVHGIYHITDRLSATVGARRTDDQKTVTVYRRDFNGTVLINNATIDVSSTRTDPKVGVDYKLTDTAMVYALYSRGFRGGGFGPRPSNAQQLASFEPENLDNYEVGAKTEWFDRRLRLNGAVFHSIYTDQQLTQATCLPCAPTAVPWFRTINTGESKMKGAELELMAVPFEGWQVEGSMGYLDYELTDPGLTTLTRNLPDGRRFYPNRTPKWNFAAGTQYRWTLANGASLTPRVDWSHQSRIYFNNTSAVQPNYSLVQARVTWASPDDAWQLALFGTNLTDKEYFDGKLGLRPNLGREQGNIAPPRQWGLTVKRSF